MIDEIKVSDSRWEYRCQECGNIKTYTKRKPIELISCPHGVIKKQITENAEQACCNNKVRAMSKNTCEFVLIENTIYTGNYDKRAICQWCGRIALDDDIKKEFPCTGERTSKFIGPSLAVKAFNFTKAYLEHKMKGSVDCTQEQINVRFEICVPCDMYNKMPDPHGSCRVCGCYVNTLMANRGLNKLAWAEQKCEHPDGSKWGSVDNI